MGESDNDKHKLYQDFYLAMFYYGIGSSKKKWYNRIAIAFNYIRTGKMFVAQLTLSPNEAKKLADFIYKNIEVVLLKELPY